MRFQGDSSNQLFVNQTTNGFLFLRIEYTYCICKYMCIFIMEYTRYTSSDILDLRTCIDIWVLVSMPLGPHFDREIELNTTGIAPAFCPIANKQVNQSMEQEISGAFA